MDKDGRLPVRPHPITLMLTDYEWNAVQADAREVGTSVEVMLSLVVAFVARANLASAACLALHDITIPPSQYLREHGLS